MSELERRLALTSLILRWSEAMRGDAAQTASARIAAAGSQHAGAGGGARRRTRVAHGHDRDRGQEPRRARRLGAGEILRPLAAHDRLPQDHHGILASVSGRARAACRRRPAQCRHPRRGAPARGLAAEGPGDHRRRQRLDPGDGRAHAHRDGAAARRHRAAGARSRARRRKLGHDQADRCRCHGASRASAIRHEDVARWAGAFARGCLGAEGRGAGARSGRAFRVRVRGHAARRARRHAGRPSPPRRAAAR